MKLQLACLMAVLSLTACGEHHHSVHATERVAEASERAFAKAPKAEAIKFDDEGMPKIHETANASANSTADTATTTDSTATAAADTTATADTASTDANTAPADSKTADKPADTATAAADTATTADNK